ncbi:MAG: hypothetical protein ACREXR_13775 [Gammaproteobacteria bacterium]
MGQQRAPQPIVLGERVGEPIEHYGGRAAISLGLGVLAELLETIATHGQELEREMACGQDRKLRLEPLMPRAADCVHARHGHAPGAAVLPNLSKPVSYSGAGACCSLITVIRPPPPA